MADFKLQYLYRIPSRQGAERWYFWRGKGQPRVRIHETPGSPAFLKRYHELLNTADMPGLAKTVTRDRKISRAIRGRVIANDR